MTDTHTALSERVALILVDVQYDFLETGTLPVPDGSHILPTIDKLIALVKANHGIVIATQDWHPKDHISFASNHHKREPFETVTLCSDKGKHYDLQLWPDHCVQDSHGASLAFDTTHVDYYVKKGTDTNVDSFSAFVDNLSKTTTELPHLLQRENITTVVIAGLAADFCVKMTCLDAVKFGFRPILVRGGTRAVVPETMEDTIRAMQDAGVRVVNDPHEIPAAIRTQPFKSYINTTTA